MAKPAKATRAPATEPVNVLAPPVYCARPDVVLLVGNFSASVVAVVEAAETIDAARVEESTGPEEMDEAEEEVTEAEVTSELEMCASMGTVVAGKLVVTGEMGTVLTNVESPEVSVVTALEITVE